MCSRARFVWLWQGWVPYTFLKQHDPHGCWENFLLPNNFLIFLLAKILLGILCGKRSTVMKFRDSVRWLTVSGIHTIPASAKPCCVIFAIDVCQNAVFFIISSDASITVKPDSNLRYTGNKNSHLTDEHLLIHSYSMNCTLSINFTHLYGSPGKQWL